MLREEGQSSRKNSLFRTKRLRKYFIIFALTTISFVTGISNAFAATIVEFDYTGHVQSWIAPKAGKYQLEVWGAQGGQSGWNGTEGMKGAYSSGSIELKEGESLEIYVGGAGNPGNYGNHSSGGWNGGGEGGLYHGGSGGGATDIRKDGISDNDRIIVAGGGGGAGQENDQGFSTDIGGNNSSTGEKGIYDNGGGGGGFLGGKSGTGGPDGQNSGTDDQGGSSGSSFFGILKDGVIQYYVREGNGYAKITLIELQQAVKEREIVDTTPPKTKIEINSSSLVEDLYNSDVTIYLSATDDLSGVNRIEYKIDGGEWITYNEVVILTKDGVTAFEYRSIDNERNTEATNYVSINIKK